MIASGLPFPLLQILYIADELISSLILDADSDEDLANLFAADAIFDGGQEMESETEAKIEVIDAIMMFK